jgi:uncharacterized protein YbjT (DUF2867 family)
MTIVVTGANGMFGGGVTRHLARLGAPVRAMARNEQRAQQLEAPGVEPLVGDMDRPDTLDDALRGAETVFIVSPMDEKVLVRETNVLEAAKRVGVKRVMKLYGAVEHHDDPLVTMHKQSIRQIQQSGLEWALLSPTSVTDTSMLSMIPWIEHTGAMIASSGEGKCAMVTADNVTEAGANALATHWEAGREYVITGSQLVNYGELSELLSAATGRSIPYYAITDQQLSDLLVKEAGMTPEQAEIGVICHFRAWRNGDAMTMTDTYHELTGKQPTTPAEWIQDHKETFAQARDKAPQAG